MTNSGLTGLKLENYQPLREVVFEHLRNSILNADLKPGERLMEVQLAEQLGVSRTPIREAIRKLELEGLVVMVARKGAYVADVSVKDILDVLEVRNVLEGLAAALCAERITDEELENLKLISDNFKKYLEEDDTEGMVEMDMQFHDQIIQSTRNAKLIQISQGLQEQVHRFRITYFEEFGKDEGVLKEHKSILEAIVNKDTVSAQRVAQQHVDTLKQSIAKFVDKL